MVNRPAGSNSTGSRLVYPSTELLRIDGGHLLMLDASKFQLKHDLLLMILTVMFRYNLIQVHLSGRCLGTLFPSSASR